MNIPAWCIRNNRASFFMLALFGLLGLQTYFALPRLENPEFVMRVAMIRTVFPGASPLKVEQLVTDPLEEKLRGIVGIDHITSQSLNGVSLIIVEVKESFKDMKPIWDKVRSKVGDVKAELPSGVLDPIVDDEFGDNFGIVLALTGDGYTYRELKDVADDVRDELLALSDVAKIDLYGTQEERIFVEFSNTRLAEAGISPAMLVEVLSRQNIVQPGGNAKVGPDRVVIEPTGEYKTVQDIRRTVLRLPGQAGTIYLEDLASVWRGFVDPPSEMAYANNQPAIVLAINMSKNGRITELGPTVLQKLEELTADLPMGLDFRVIAYQPKFVRKAINDFMINLAEAFLFVFIVVLLFAGLRTGLTVGILVPMAMLLCMMLMPVFDVSLQKISIASLIIALGILVDNGVVVSEDILSRLAHGEERLKACSRAATSLAMPMLAATLSTIFAFLPIPMAQSTTGEYCFSLFIVVTITLLASWVLAMTMIPLLSFYLLKPKLKQQTFTNLFYRIYRGLLVMNLKARSIHVLLVIGLTAIAIWSFKFVPTIFFPPNEREMFFIDLYMPYGFDIEVTQQRTAELEKHLLAMPEVASIGTFVGNPGPRWYLSLDMSDNGTHYARLIINTHTTPDVDRVLAEAKAYMDDHFPEVRYVANKLENGPPVGAPIQVRISGPDIKTIYTLRNQLITEMKQVSGVINIRDNWGDWTKKMRIYVEQDEAKKAGFTSQDIALSLMTQISGYEATEYREGEKIIPIVLRSKDLYREDLGLIEGMNVYSWQDERSIPLLQLARAKMRWQPSNIRRRDGQRTMTVKADVEGRFASAVITDIQSRMTPVVNSETWPLGYKLAYGGQFEESANASASIQAGLPLAGGLILLLLVLQFNSMRRMLIIILTIPPMMFGITFGLIATKAPFGFMAMLGLISLTGIIINNAIILIDSIEKERSKGQAPQNAVVIAAQKRLRPIIMTATTTIVGLLPLSYQGGEMWRPMANTLIFGLAFSTLLTLVLCPVLYSLFFRIRFRGYQWDAKVLQETSK
jgi:multidrug efflux pump subunit AcrB